MNVPVTLNNELDIAADTVTCRELYVDGTQITAAGIVGPPGPAGPPGATGPAGPAGATGATGQPGAAGATGATGPAGPTGATGSLIATFRGVWSNATPYAIGDVVLYAENNDAIYSCYLATQASTNAVPPSPGQTSIYWSFIAVHGVQGVKGDTGDTGPRGPKGDTGDRGPQGEQGPAGQDAPPFSIESIIAAILSAVYNSAQFALINARITALETAVGAIVVDVGVQSQQIAALEAKTALQTGSVLTGNTSFGGNTLTKTNAGGFGSAVTLNAASASVFSLGASVSGGLATDTLTTTGAITAPGVSISTTGLATSIGANSGSVIHIGNQTELSTVYIHGLVYMPTRDSFDSFGLKYANGFFSQFP
jgi:hypothetical protein